MPQPRSAATGDHDVVELLAICERLQPHEAPLRGRPTSTTPAPVGGEPGAHVRIHAPRADAAPASTPASTSRRRRSETTHLDKDAFRLKPDVLVRNLAGCPRQMIVPSTSTGSRQAVHHCEIGLVRRPKRPVERPPIEAADRSFRHRLSGCPRRLRLQSRGSRHALNSLRDYRPGGAEARQEPGM